MTTIRPRPAEKRKWYGLSLRHLRIARRLLGAGFSDGAVFHVYHAYECALSAMIAAQGYVVPPEGWTKLAAPSGKPISSYPSPSGGIQERSAHKARVIFFNELSDHAKPYFATHSILSRFLTLSDRNRALYYDAVRDRLPHEAFNRSFAAALLPRIRQFAQELWQDIR